MKNLLPASVFTWLVMLAVAVLLFTGLACAAEPPKEKAKLKARAALALAAAAEAEEKPAKVVADAKPKCADCGPSCACTGCDCDETPTKFTRVVSKPDPLRQVLAEVMAGQERIVYVGYRPPPTDSKAVSLSSFDGQSKGVFRCFRAADGKPCYEERRDLIPTKAVTRTRTEPVKVCNGNGTCHFENRIVSETVQVPDELE
jgi:hypothetical protein